MNIIELKKFAEPLIADDLWNAEWVINELRDIPADEREAWVRNQSEKRVK